MVITSLTQIILSRRRSDQVVATIKKEVVEGNEKVAQAVDGQLSKYVQEVRRAERSVGREEGGEAERSRPPDLITEPAKVAEAMNGREVRDQINDIEKSIEDVKDAATAVAEDLARSHERADAHAGGESGEAADAAARLTRKDKELLKGDKDDNIQDSVDKK